MCSTYSSVMGLDYEPPPQSAVFHFGIDISNTLARTVSIMVASGMFSSFFLRCPQGTASTIHILRWSSVGPAYNPAI